MRTAHLNTLAILLFSALATACSYTSDFFVVNNSAEPVEVTYKLKLARHLTKEDVPGKIPKATLGKVHRSDIPKLNDDQYRYDAKNDTISVMLPPAKRYGSQPTLDTLAMRILDRKFPKILRSKPSRSAGPRASYGSTETIRGPAFRKFPQLSTRSSIHRLKGGSVTEHRNGHLRPEPR